MHTVFALLCFVVVIHWLIFPYPSRLLHWHCGNLTIAPVPAKQPWWIWINTSCEFITNDCITTIKQSTTKPCAYFLGYIVSIHPYEIVLCLQNMGWPFNAAVKKNHPTCVDKSYWPMYRVTIKTMMIVGSKRCRDFIFWNNRKSNVNMPICDSMKSEPNQGNLSDPHPAWINNHTPSKVRGEITYPFPNFKGSLLKFGNGYVIAFHTL